MNKLQLIMLCGVLFAAGLTWQLASQGKLQTAGMDAFGRDATLSEVALNAPLNEKIE